MGRVDYVESQHFWFAWSLVRWLREDNGIGRRLSSQERRHKHSGYKSQERIWISTYLFCLYVTLRTYHWNYMYFAKTIKYKQTTFYLKNISGVLRIFSFTFCSAVSKLCTHVWKTCRYTPDTRKWHLGMFRNRWFLIYVFYDTLQSRKG